MRTKLKTHIRILSAMFMVWGGLSCAPKGEPCEVYTYDDGSVLITCPDGSNVTIEQGAMGENGPQGDMGQSCSASDNGNGTYTITCPGQEPFVVADGVVGDSGDQGNDGADMLDGDSGSQGQSCMAEEYSEGVYTVTCGEGEPFDVHDGGAGAQGGTGNAGAAGDDCDVSDNGDGTATISCEGGSSVTFAIPICGNGASEGGEECDDGNRDVEHCPEDEPNCHICDANCYSIFCGDGIVNAYEECDDGNLNESDGCLSTCYSFDFATQNSWALMGPNYWPAYQEEIETTVANYLADCESATCDVVYDEVELTSLPDGANFASAFEGGVLGKNNKIYAIPRASTKILEIDPENPQDAQLLSWKTFSGNNTKWRGGALGANGKIYAFPQLVVESSVLEIDTDAQSAATLFAGTAPLGESYYSGGVLAPNGKIYGLPVGTIADDWSIAIVDTNSSVATLDSFVLGAEYEIPSSGSVLAPNGKIYGIPNNGSNILVADPGGETLSLEILPISSGGVDLTTITNYWMSGVVTTNGCIYGIPYDGTHVLKIDSANHSATVLEISTTTTEPEDNLKWIGGVLAPDGKIYAMPFTAQSLLVIDPSDDSMSEVGDLSGMTGTNRWFGGVLAPNGSVYTIPFSAESILTVNFQEVVPPNVFEANVLYSSYFNHF